MLVKEKENYIDIQAFSRCLLVSAWTVVIMVKTQMDTSSIKPWRLHLLKYSFFFFGFIIFIIELAVFFLVSKVLVKLKQKTNGCASV